MVFWANGLDMRECWELAKLRTAFATIPLSFSSRTRGTVEVTVLYVVAHNQGMAIGDAGFCATYSVPRLDGSGSYMRTRHVARKVSTIKYY
jgi:hypothetical protein